MKKYLVVLVAAVVCFCGQAFGAGSDLVIDTEFVKDKIGKPGWVIIDTRFDEDYSDGHLPGAVGVPGWVSKMFADDTKRQATVLPRMEQTLGEMGISSESQIIVYGDPASTGWNAVMFWILESLGCNSSLQKCTARYYDGGVARWKADGGVLDEGETAVKPSMFKAAAGAKRGVKADEMLRIVEGRQKAVILDVRTPGEFNGTDIRALRGGHMPRAVNIEYAKNFDPETFRMLPLEQVRAVYKDVPRNSRVITYCQAGGRAAYTYLVLRALGYPDVAVYHDGWRVFGSDLKLPVEDETWYDFHRVNATIKAVKELQEE